MNKNQLWMLGSSYVISIKFLVKACDGSQLVLMPSSLREVTEKKLLLLFY